MKIRVKVVCTFLTLSKKPPPLFQILATRLITFHYHAHHFFLNPHSDKHGHIFALTFDRMAGMNNFCVENRQESEVINELYWKKAQHEELLMKRV